MGRIHDDVDHFSRFTCKAVGALNKDGDAQAAEAMQLELRYHVRHDLKTLPHANHHSSGLLQALTAGTDSDSLANGKGDIQTLRDISNDLVSGIFGQCHDRIRAADHFSLTLLNAGDDAV